MTLDDIRAQMKNDNASFQMNWNAGEDDMAMYCWWKANSNGPRFLDNAISVVQLV
jgi:hypothetical protein